MALVEYDEFKGNKMIRLKDKEDSKYPFQFGQGKAKLIVQHFEAIKTFAAGGAKSSDDIEMD